MHFSDQRRKHVADWVIIVDDDSVNLHMAGHILSDNGMKVTALKSGSTLIKYIRDNGAPDICLLDILMPKMDGFETLVQLRALEKELNIPEIPVIFLTADDNRANEMRGFQMGVSDFIHKPFDPDVLVQRIKNVIDTNHRMMSIEAEASRDKLTGLLNKESTNVHISLMCKEKVGCLCMIDLDSFKLVNDIYGHDMGDKVIKLFANILTENMTEGSVVGRIGGDEFLMFGMEMQRESDISAFTMAINDALIKGAKELMGADMRIPLGASVGTVLVPNQGTVYEELFHMADKALYIVKDNGKHGYAFYHGDNAAGIIGESARTLDLKAVTKLLEERNIPQSVMWMGREAFGNVYRYMMRYLERYDISAYKALFTIVYADSASQDKEHSLIADTLREVIQTSLRNSDIMVQTGTDQFFLLLPELNPEHVDRVIERILKAWDKTEYRNITRLEYEYAGVLSGNEEDTSNNDQRQYNVVVVDDSSINIKMAQHILGKEGMKVTGLSSGAELIEHLSGNDPDLILLDINMPEMDGFETMQQINAKGGRISRIPIIFLTANDDDSTEARGFAMGAMDFIRKPFVPEILIMRVKHAISLIRLQNRLKSEVNEKIEENENLSIHIIQALTSAIDAKDMYTSGHSDRVALYSRMIAEKFGYDQEAQNEIYMMGLLHDVGKIGISDSIINKTGPLDDNEYAVIKTHPEKGATILNNIPELPGLITGARWHHERFDGGGYPDGLNGTDIPEEARIIAVADSYDAMTSRRSYRDALSQDVVRSELVKGRGTQFDPTFADIMISLIDKDPDYKMREK